MRRPDVPMSGASGRRLPSGDDAFARVPDAHSSSRRAGSLPSPGGARERLGTPSGSGWGPIGAVVPFTVTGSVLTFSAPLADVRDRSTDGRFRTIAPRGAYRAWCAHRR